jgi:DNA-binding transcriptional LysR family regulator
MSIKKCKKMAAFSAAISKNFLLDRSVGVEHRQGGQELDILALGLLQSGKVDIAFASTPQDASSLSTFRCFDTHSIFVAAADYDCNFDHIYTLEEIIRFPLILLERKASSRLHMDKFFLQNGHHLNPEIELGARSLLVDLAAIGFGVAGVTEEFVKNELASGKLRKLQTDFAIPPRSVDLCILRDVPQTSAAQKFMQFVQANL